MRISTYARVTNPKYANFVDWSNLAGSLGIKAGAALNAAKGALPTTATGAAKLGAGIGAGVGAVNYLGSQDKSIGNLAGQVAGGAAIGGAAGYGGASLKNAYQARKAGQVGGQTMLAPAATPVPAQAVVNQPIQTNAPTPQAQLPAGQSLPTNQQTIDVNSSAIVEPKGYQQPKPLPTKNADGVVELPNPDTVGVGTEQSMPLSQQKRLDVRRKKYPAEGFRSGNMKAEQAFDANGQPFSRNTSPFANFKVRRYNGFIY